MRNFVPMILLCAGFASCTQPTTSDKMVTDSTTHEALAETQDTVHTSQNSLDWTGTYEGTIPCADCPGIKTTIILHDDETFQVTSEYLDRDLKVEDTGKLMWHDHGSVIHLTGKETDIKLKVGENQLFQLDQDGRMITGDLAENYIYKKKDK
ncbi:copper resistance protein NlpE [Sphingobacterium suaedae]|uniref:Copper resistance protein NlpE n=1 Tax=Sphingobacterium suaedae TaxID=1686402 RepID=A0ABW5KMP6_9SPHI